MEYDAIDGVKIIELPIFEDNRGLFCKPYSIDNFDQMGLTTNWREFYYSSSKKNVFRGMHFQKPPVAHDKFVFCINGLIEDIVLDIRRKSKTYGKFMKIRLDSARGVFIPKGIAHGFYTIEDSIVGYLVETTHNKKYDDGIKYDSFGYNPKVNNVILSERDRDFVEFKHFESPF